MKIIIFRALRLLGTRDRRVLSLIVTAQALLGFLDLAGVGVIGVLGALSVSGVESKSPGNRVSGILKFLKIENLEFQNQVAILGVMAALLLLTRTLATVFFTRRSTYYLTRKSALLAGNLISKLLSRDLLVLRKRTIQETLYALSIGVTSITVGLIGSLVNLVADVSVLTLIVCGLFAVDLSIAISTVVLFAGVGFLIYRLQQSRARKLGIEFSKLNVESEEKIVEVLNSFRELSVHDRQMKYATEIEQVRLRISNILAELNFMPQISKYVIESTVIIGALLISGIQFMRQDSSHAVAILSIFMASGSRIAPAVMRIQQGLVTMKTSVGSADPTLDLIDELETVILETRTSVLPDFIYKGFVPTVELKDVCFSFPGSETPVLNKVTLQIEQGQHVAFVGPSGGGKTTLVDLILGILTPSEGDVKISGYSPTQAIRTWPGAISYVPQEIRIMKGTLKENIALGFGNEAFSKSNFERAIKIAKLEKLVEDLPNGIESTLNEQGSNLSGGQRQRLGIARSLYSAPKLLVLDEATSALDAETEDLVSKGLQNLGNKTTMLIIAHRLSTVRNADVVFYVDKGEIVARGSFEDVRRSVANFDLQANLMGLISE